MFDTIKNFFRKLKKGKNMNADTSPNLDDTVFLAGVITYWKNSPRRADMLDGERYYDGAHDILLRKREVIGENGELTPVENLPNNKIVDNQYAKMVNQKVNYLLGQPFVIRCENEAYAKTLSGVFGKRFMKTLKNAGKYALNNGISWLFPYYDNDGELSFRMFPGSQVLPFWEDDEHSRLGGAVRLYAVASWENSHPVQKEKVEVYTSDGVRCYSFDGGTLTAEGSFPYVTQGGSSLNWLKIPLVPVRYNESEQPLIKKIRSLQDGINIMLSDFENNMQEDSHNTVIVLKGYDGENLGEFRRNLAQYHAVKVSGFDGENGGVDTLEITVNADNYKAILELFKKALIENAMGYDAKDDRLSGNPNQMNIQSMYSDIDLDANDMETELQAAFDDILFFVNAHLSNIGKGSSGNENVEIVFNRDILINETEAITNCISSLEVLSEETVVTQHPWVDDPQTELERLKKQRQQERKRLTQENYNPFKDDGEE